jgi:hypothetical protein
MIFRYCIVSLRVGLFLFVGVVEASAQKASSAKPFERFDGCMLEPDEWTDGDSFRVRLPDGRLETFACISLIQPSLGHAGNGRTSRRLTSV